MSIFYDTLFLFLLVLATGVGLSLVGQILYLLQEIDTNRYKKRAQKAKERLKEKESTQTDECGQWEEPFEEDRISSEEIEAFTKVLDKAKKEGILE